MSSIINIHKYRLDQTRLRVDNYNMVIENMYNAKTHLSRLVEKALEGEDVILAKAGKPLVRLIPYVDIPEPIHPGLLKGKVKISDDFDDLSPEIEDMFDGYLP